MDKKIILCIVCSSIVLFILIWIIYFGFEIKFEHGKHKVKMKIPSSTREPALSADLARTSSRSHGSKCPYPEPHSCCQSLARRCATPKAYFWSICFPLGDTPRTWALAAAAVLWDLASGQIHLSIRVVKPWPSSACHGFDPREYITQPKHLPWLILSL